MLVFTLNNLYCFVFSSHNWNALFLGANAVADVLAEKYEAEKRKILDTVSGFSLNKITL